HISDFTGGTLNDQDSITVTAAVTDGAGNNASATNSPSFLLDNNADVGTAQTQTAASDHRDRANATLSLADIDSDVASGTITVAHQHCQSATYPPTSTLIPYTTLFRSHISDFTGGTLNDQDSITVTAAVTDGAGNNASATNSPSFLLDNNADVG